MIISTSAAFFTEGKFGPSQGIKLSKKTKLTNIKIAFNSFSKPYLRRINI
jgi:hypothetical protein